MRRMIVVEGRAWPLHGLPRELIARDHDFGSATESARPLTTSEVPEMGQVAPSNIGRGGRT